MPPASEPSPFSRREFVSIRIVFFIAGLAMSAWAPLVPYAKARAGLGDGELGLLLLCLGAGSLVTMPLAGIFTARYGCRRAITTSLLIALAAIPLLATLSTLPRLAAALLLFGGGMGALDVSMNILAVLLERDSGRTLMSGLHGLFSLGCIVGAATTTLLLGLQAPPPVAALAIVMLGLLLLVTCGRALRSSGSPRSGPFFALPRGVVLLIGVFCFIAFLTEGAILDWSAVLLSSVHQLETSRAGIGYALFAVAMTLGRFLGDSVILRFGVIPTTMASALCAALGVLAAAFLPTWELALAGYVLLGIGCSNLAPIMFSAAGRQREMPESLAIPAISTLGYAGILAGPAAIGLVSHLTTLTVAFFCISLLLFAVAGSARFLRH